MRCKIEYMPFLIGEEEPEQEIELFDGIKLELGRENNTNFINPKMDEVQVICEADFVKKELVVTRRGRFPSSDNDGKEIELGTSGRISDGHCFYLLDENYRFTVNFHDDESQSSSDSGMDWSGDVYIGNVAYDPDSHSYKREIEFLVYDEELVIDTEDECEDIPMD